MGHVVVVIKVFPSSSEIDMNSILKNIREKLPKEYSLIDHREEDIAFGLKSLILGIKMPEDKEGGTFELESFLSSIEGIGSINILSVSRISG